MQASPLRVVVVAPPFYEVPPRGYGGTELVCHALVEGLIDRGHEVTLVAAGDGQTRARLVQTFSKPQPEGTDADTHVELVHTARTAVALDGLDVDVVHDHSRVGPLTAAARAAPTVVTCHASLAGPESQLESFALLGRWTSLVAISDAQRGEAPSLPWVATVHNGIPVAEYPFRADKEGFVLYLGRLSRNKGVHLAIDAAEAAGRDLVIAGSWTTPSERRYFEDAVRPRLGARVEWLGEVRSSAKKDLLARAACLMSPTRWSEPFGLSLVEAMACGTPVVALRAGAIPELVADGEAGIVCDTPEQLPAAIEAAAGIDPARCRATVERRFGAARMVAGYEAVYRQVLGLR